MHHLTKHCHSPRSLQALAKQKKKLSYAELRTLDIFNKFFSSPTKQVENSLTFDSLCCIDEFSLGFWINNASFNNIRRNSWCFHSENLKQETTGFKRGKCTDLKRPQVWLYKLHGTLKLLLNFVYLELRSYGHQHHASPKGFQRCFFRTSSLSIFFLERKLRRISSKFCDLCLYFNEGWRNNLTYCTSTWRLQGPKSLL